MIEAKIGSTQLVERLTRKARVLAEAHGESQRLKARNSPAKWRDPRLLWPLGNKE